MKTTILALSVIAVMITPVLAEESASCEATLASLRTAEMDSLISLMTMAKVKALESEGNERCKADDDQGANALFAEAFKILDN